MLRGDRISPRSPHGTRLATDQATTGNTRMPTPAFDWSIAVFARNEAASLAPCLEAIYAGLGGRRATVTLMLNGCTDGSGGVAAALAARAPVPVQVWQIGFADKSNAWNQFIHAVRPAAHHYAFLDAYARVQPGALAALRAALEATPSANAAAAVPSCGRSAAATRDAMLANPALHGSLHALRGDFVERIAARGLRLPVGLYRGDGLLGSMVMHDLDAAANPWDPARIAVAAGASWQVRPLSPLRPADLRRYWNRRIQQARGRLEDAALREAIYRDGFANLPRYADAMLLDWLAGNPPPADRFSRLAVQRLRQPRSPGKAELVACRQVVPAHAMLAEAVPCG